MNAPNNLGTVLTVVFSVCLAALVFEILYVLWSRRRFHRRGVTRSGDDLEFNSSSESLYPTPSKELLYFCWRSQTTRVKPDSTTQPAASTAATTVSADGEDELVEEMLKLQGMYGPSRVLFTIKEEDREEMEITENEESSIENVLVKSEERKMSSSGVCFEEIAVANDMVVEVEDVTTPFWTPCESPQNYYTPPPSPSRVVLGDSVENTMSFASIEIHS
ncbi:hypothetical protein OIU76_009196 [Salix suchowensis]|nr:hypothetical protein OIU76_009196 [Salix suchowensis]